MSGLMDNPIPLLAHCYEIYIKNYLDGMRTGTYGDEEAERQLKEEGKNSGDMSLFDSLYRESTVQLPGRPLRNQYINQYNHLYDDDTTPVYRPSQFYDFAYMKKEVVLGEVRGTEIPECAMVVTDPDESVKKSLLKTCRKISEHQAVTDLSMEEVRCESLTAEELPLISAHARSLILIQCTLPMCYLRYIVRQLSQSVHTLQNLELSDMDLNPIEKELDELLERLVSHHESGKAQSKLILIIGGDKEEPSNLSQEFVKKWTQRCEGIESITRCDIGDY